MTHAQLVRKAIEWLRSYRCGIVLSEQACISGEVPDAIGWKGAWRSVVVECKLSRSDFLADRSKPFRLKPELGLGCERWYLAPAGLLSSADLPPRWGLLECRARKLRMTPISVFRPATRSWRQYISGPGAATYLVAKAAAVVGVYVLAAVASGFLRFRGSRPVSFSPLLAVTFVAVSAWLAHRHE